jgi:amino acid permease
MLSLSGIIFITLVVLVQTPYYVHQNTDLSENLVLMKLDNSIVDAASLTIFAYDGIINIPTIFSELQHRSTARMHKVTFRACLMLMLLYSTLGILGYISYAGNVPNLIVFRPPPGPGEDWLMVTAQLIVAFSLMFSVPIKVIPTRKSLEHMFFSSGQFGSFGHTVSTVLILVCSMSLAILFPDTLGYFKITGGLFGVVLVFILPSDF